MPEIGDPEGSPKNRFLFVVKKRFITGLNHTGSSTLVLPV
jgi:hypothetical protein